MTKVSRSTKLAPALAMKYSSAMLRPPATAITPSAMNSLLCMRRCTRSKSRQFTAKRVRKFCRPAGNGLNSRTSAFGWASSPSSSGSMPEVYRSSMIRRTRTPRSAALRSVRSR